MKELSIEEKAKRYDEAIIRAKSLIGDTIIEETGQHIVEVLFPELKESEDERIRKALIDYFRWNPNSQLLNEFTNREVFAWLEKQESVEEIVERCKNSWYNEGKIAGMAEGLTDDEKYQQGWHDALEKQGDKPAIIDINSMVSKYANTKEACTNGLPVNCQIRAYRQGINDALRLSLNLEKQGEKRHKIQPKFKIGDIIRFKGNETLNGEAETHKIVSYDNELYVFADGTTDLFCEQDLYELVEQKTTDRLGVLNFIRKETCCGLAEANNALLELIKVLKEHPSPIMDKPSKLKIEWEEQQ